VRVKDRTRCSLTVRDVGTGATSLSGDVTLAQTPTEMGLSGCHLTDSGPGRASCSFSARTDATLAGFHGPSTKAEITAAFGGDLVHDAAGASTEIDVQQVRGCGLTHEAETHFYAWLCPAHSRTPLTELHASAKVAGGTLALTSPYACEVITTPITFSATFSPGGHSPARLTKVVFSFGASPSKTVRHSPFHVRFFPAHKSGAKRRVIATAVASLTEGRHHLTRTVLVSVPHC
jgi:type 1 fimbria pilin